MSNAPSFRFAAVGCGLFLFVLALLPAVVAANPAALALSILDVSLSLKDTNSIFDPFCSAGFTSSELTFDTTNIIYVGQVRQAKLTWKWRRCPLALTTSGASFDVTFQMKVSGSWTDVKKESFGGKAPFGESRYESIANVQIVDDPVGSVEIRAKIKANFGTYYAGASYQSCTKLTKNETTNTVVFTVLNPVTNDVPQSVTVPHLSTTVGRPQDLVVHNDSTEPFVLDFVVIGDQAWDSDCAGSAGGDGRNRSLTKTGCITHDEFFDCAVPVHTFLCWEEDFRYSGRMFLSYGIEWRHTPPALCVSHTCCGTSGQPECTTSPGACTADADTVSCSPFVPANLPGNFTVGPVLDPTVPIPGPFTFEIGSPPEVIQIGDLGVPPVASVDTVAAQAVIDMVSSMPAANVAISVSGPPSFDSGIQSHNNCDSPCGSSCNAPLAYCRAEQCDPPQGGGGGDLPTTPTDSSGLAQFSGLFALGSSFQVSLGGDPFHSPRDTRFPVGLLDGQTPIYTSPRFGPILDGTVRLPDGRGADGTVYAVAPPHIAERVQSLTDEELRDLGVPLDDPLVEIDRNRVLIPLSSVEDGVVQIESTQLQELGFPTAELVFRTPYLPRGTQEPATELYNLEATVVIPTREAVDAEDTEPLPPVQLVCPPATDCDVPDPLQVVDDGGMNQGGLDPWTLNIGSNPGRPVPEIAVEDVGSLESALHVTRANDTDGSHAIARQEANHLVLPGRSLELSFDVRIDSHNFGNYGSWNVYPANVWVDYYDGLGDPYTVRRSFYTFVGSGSPDPPPLAEQIPQGQWVHRTFDLSGVSPPIAEVRRVRAGSQGWSYDASFDNISLLLGTDIKTSGDVDVIFTVDTTRATPPVGPPFLLRGSQPPLSFDAPGLTLLDDGLGQDASAGDGIFTATVRFPAGTQKSIAYKYLSDDIYECVGGTRSLYLDDDAFDVVGGVNGPMTLPLAYYDRCGTISQDVEVIFRVAEPPVPKSHLDVRLLGSEDPLDWDAAAGLVMLDDGNPPDALAGDAIYTGSVVFPSDTPTALTYRYAVDGEYENPGAGGRAAMIDDSFDATGNPQVLSLDVLLLDTSVPDARTLASVRLMRAHPNPFNPSVVVTFEVMRRQEVDLVVYDARGRYVATIVRREFSAGVHQVEWNGTDKGGQPVTSAVYYARVRGGGPGLKLTLLR